MSAPRSRLVALEGGEATGKSTQARLLAQALGAVLTHEPGGTAVGRAIRALVLDPDLTSLDPRAETLLLAADRAQHIAEVVEPALAAGKWVITDRFAGSSLAYQGYGRGLPLDELKWLSSWAAKQRWPDLTLLLEVPPAEADRRRADAAAPAVLRRPNPPDRLEREGSLFHAQVQAGYRALARARPEDWVVIDGSGTPQEVASRVLEAVVSRLGQPASTPTAGGTGAHGQGAPHGDAGDLQASPPSPPQI